MENLSFHETPVGIIGIADNGKAITRLFFGRETPASGEYVTTETGLAKEAVRQLKEYFAGKRQDLDLPIAPTGTAFQKKVWDALCRIPYGETRSYGQIAAETGNPRACRAVGLANNRNPIAIVIPCHRVIGADGTLTGYAGGEEVKRFLLELESAL